MFNQKRRVVAETSELVEVDTGICMYCNKGGTVLVPKEVWEKWDNGNGPFIQRLWPQGSADEREQLINGTHGPCFDKMFPPEEE